MTTRWYYPTGGAQTFLVPAGVTSVDLVCYGACGHQEGSGFPRWQGGNGGTASGTLAVSPGQVLNIFVGGSGQSSAGGFNGGGTSPGFAGGGGGASDVRVGGTALANRVIVAGGGGGAYGVSGFFGGQGGGTTGAAGSYQYAYPGTQTSGNALGVGGDGDAGGGGGYWGGNTSSGNGTGAGGSGYTGGVSAASMTTGDSAGAGSVKVTYTDLPPNAPIKNTPANNQTLDRGVLNRFGWTPSDPDAGDSQSKFDLQYRLGAGAWTTITQTTPNSFWDALAGTFALGLIEWQVRTYDAQGLVGPYCASGFFTAADSTGAPAITTPTNGSMIGLTSATLTWSTPSQTNYQVRKMDDVAGAAGTTVYYDSGDVVDATTRSVTLAFPVNNRFEHVQVRVKTAGLWSPWADVRVQVSWAPPMIPSVVAFPDSAQASIAVVVTNPIPTGGQPATAYNDFFISSPLDPEYRAATMVPPNSMWVWKGPASMRTYQIRAVAVGANGTTMTSIDGVPPTPPADPILDGGVL